MPHGIVSSDDEATKGYAGKLVAKTVEETLDALPDEEADQLVNAGRYERTEERQAYRGGHYGRRLVTGAGELEPSVPKLRGATSATKVVERYRRRESSVEEAMMETCLAGVSTRRIEDVSEILWGSSVSAGTVSNLNRKAFAKVEEWRTRPLTCSYPYACVDGTYLKRNWGGAYESVAVLIATGVNEDGYRELIGCAEGYTESADSWREFLLSLRDRGPRGVRMVTGDKSAGMLGALQEVFPEGHVPAMHRVLLPQRPGEGARPPQEARRRPAQGRPRPGVAGSGPPQGRGGGPRAGDVEAGGRREGDTRGSGRDADLREVPDGALAADPHQQRHRAAQPRGQEAHQRGRQLPRRKVRDDAGGREVQVRGGRELGQEEVPRHVAAGPLGREEREHGLATSHQVLPT